MALGLVKIKRRKAKRVGRGSGSGKGMHTSTRGHKGQKSRSGHNIPSFFEGGQIPLIKRLPQKRGVGNPKRAKSLGINLARLNKLSEKEVLTPKLFVEKGIVKKIPKEGIKILAGGEIEKPFKFKGFFCSKGAREKIEKAGGSITL